MDGSGSVSEEAVGWGELSVDSPERMKQTAAGFRKKRISLLRDMVMQTAPIAIRKRLKRASMAAATFRPAHRKRSCDETLVVRGGFGVLLLHNSSL